MLEGIEKIPLLQNFRVVEVHVPNIVDEMRNAALLRAGRILDIHFQVGPWSNGECPIIPVDDKHLDPKRIELSQEDLRQLANGRVCIFGCRLRKYIRSGYV